MTDSPAPTDVREALAMAREALDKIVSNLNYLNVPERVRRAENIAREAQSRLAALPAPAPAEAVDDDDLLTPERAWDIHINRDDRNSPEEYPDMALITFDELADFMRRARPAHPSPDGALREAVCKAAQRLVTHLEKPPYYRDRAGLRLSDVVPHFAALKDALAALSLKEPDGHE